MVGVTTLVKSRYVEIPTSIAVYLHVVVYPRISGEMDDECYVMGLFLPSTKHTPDFLVDESGPGECVN